MPAFQKTVEEFTNPIPHEASTAGKGESGIGADPSPMKGKLIRGFKRMTTYTCHIFVKPYSKSVVQGQCSQQYAIQDVTPLLRLHA